MTNAFLNAQNHLSSSSHAEFVPGIGAVLSATVAVRCDFVAAEPSNPAAAKPTPALDAFAEAEWNAAATGDPTESEWVRAARSWDAESPVRQFAFDPAALGSLKQAALDTAWRFGAKLEFARGEKLAIVVVATPSVSQQQVLSGYVTQSNGNPVPGAVVGLAGASEPPVATLFGRLGRTSRQAQLPDSKRLVILISSEDLKAFRSGDVEPQEMESACSGDFGTVRDR
ncbi:MAG: hypothetical protein EXS13_01130 [Planctomycetes bacterium]|nr:hypothetical protein [Planctomycetota bacterium]